MRPCAPAPSAAVATIAILRRCLDTRQDGERGLNAKNWFYGFNTHLAERPQHTARVLCGPAAERWLAAEMYGYLAATLPEALTCYGEDGTTDLTIYETSEGDGPSIGVWTGGRVASIEIKLVYRTYPESRVQDYARTLCTQVAANRERGSALNIGFIYGVFACWPSQREHAPADFNEFRSRTSTRIRDICESSGVPCAKPALETVIDPLEVKIGGVTVPFGLIAQYVRPGAADEV